tara:strand:+ start:335 stop:511 length:177 start_codon:yes stop_codon:yes gene_type:complete
MEAIKVGDLVIYDSFDKRLGVVIEESKGYITIHWNDGGKNVIHFSSIVNDVSHSVVRV